MSMHLKRDEFEERLSQVKSAIGMMADALTRLLENGVSATAYHKASGSVHSPHTRQSVDTVEKSVQELDLVDVVSLLRNKAENHISDDQLVRMWFLALAPDRSRAKKEKFFNEKFLLPHEFLKSAVNSPERSWALLGSLISTHINESGTEFTNFGLTLLIDVCGRLPTKIAIKAVTTESFGTTSEEKGSETPKAGLLTEYLKTIETWPYEPRNRDGLVRSVKDHPELLSGTGQGEKWDTFRELAWQFAAARIGSDETLTLTRWRQSVFECKKLARPDDLCFAVANYFISALRLHRVPVSSVQGEEVKHYLTHELFDEAGKILRELIHSPWFRGEPEARSKALNAAEAFFSWLILYRGSEPQLALNLTLIASCRATTQDQAEKNLVINRHARIVFVDQACVTESEIEKRVANGETFGSILRSFHSLITHIEELAKLDGDLILTDDVEKLLCALKSLSKTKNLDQSSLCEKIVPKLRSWKGNSQLVKKDTEELIDAIDNGCMSSLF